MYTGERVRETSSKRNNVQRGARNAAGTRVPSERGPDAERENETRVSVARGLRAKGGRRGRLLLIFHQQGAADIRGRTHCRIR